MSKLRSVQRVLGQESGDEEELQSRRIAFELQEDPETPKGSAQLASQPQYNRQEVFERVRLGLASTKDRAYLALHIKGWQKRGEFAMFLSHFKAEAGT